MALQTSGAISLNDIHIEAGGSSGTSVSLNDADVRGLISKGSGVTMSFSEWYGASSGTTTTHTNNLNSYNFAAEYKGTPSEVWWVGLGTVGVAAGQAGNYTNRIPFKAFKNVTGNSTAETQYVIIKDDGSLSIVWGWTYTTGNSDYVYANRNVGQNPNFSNLKLEVGGTNSYNNLTTQNYSSFSLVNTPADGTFLGDTRVVFPARSALNSLVSSSSTSIRNFRITVTY